MLFLWCWYVSFLFQVRVKEIAGGREEKVGSTQPQLPSTVALSISLPGSHLQKEENRSGKIDLKSRGLPSWPCLCLFCVFTVLAGLHERHHRREKEGKKPICSPLPVTVHRRRRVEPRAATLQTPPATAASVAPAAATVLLKFFCIFLYIYVFI